MTIAWTAPSFVDLRAWAAEAERASVPQADFGAARRMLDLPEGPVTVGSISLAAGSGSVPWREADEFVIVVEGAITFQRAGREIALGEGASAVLPRGDPINWHAAGPTTLIFMQYRGGSAGNARIVPIDRAAALQPSGAPLAELLLSATPQCRNHADYTSPDGMFVCGMWDSTPYHRRPMKYGHYELMHLLEGEVTFVDQAGRQRTFVEQDIFLMEQHARCSWESKVAVKKVYAIYRPLS